MTAPTDSPLFATDGTFPIDGDTWQGLDVRTDPGASRMAEGFEPRPLPAAWLNHVLGVHGDWIDFLQNGDGDVRGVHGGVLNGRTALHKVDAGVATAITAAQGWRERILVAFGPPDTVTPQGYLICDLPGVKVSLDFDPGPTGATLTDVNFRVNPGVATATAADRITAQVYYRTNAGAPVYLGSATANATGSTQLITVSCGAHVIDKNANAYTLVLTSSQGADATEDEWHDWTTVFQDVGPRNY